MNGKSILFNLKMEVSRSFFFAVLWLLVVTTVRVRKNFFFVNRAYLLNIIYSVAEIKIKKSFGAG